MRDPAYPVPAPLAALGRRACAVGLVPYAPLAPASANTSETLPASWLRLSTLERLCPRYQGTCDGLVVVVSVPTSGSLPRFRPWVRPFSNARLTVASSGVRFAGSVRTTMTE